MSGNVGEKHPSVRRTHVIAPHFKRRLSGVTTTVIQLVPLQRKLLGERGLSIATMGPGLPATLPSLPLTALPRLLRRPEGARRRVWHARRNIEMLPGIILRDVFRAPLALMFTSAAQREHTAYTRWLIGRMDRVVATSAKSAAYLRRPATMIRHGIDTELFRPPHNVATERRELGLLPGHRYIGCSGRIRPNKGTGDFVEAMIRVLPERSNWTAIITGATTAEHAEFERGLKRRIEDARLTDRIRFVGQRDHIHRWFGIFDLFVAPQHWEGFGMTPLEAMASGVPVVATDVGAFSEMLTPEVGIIVPPRDVEALGDGVATFMDDDAKRQEAGLRARAHVERHFPLAGEARALCAIYEELTEPIRPR